MGEWVWRNDDGTIEVPPKELADYLTQSTNVYRNQQQSQIGSDPYQQTYQVGQRLSQAPLQPVFYDTYFNSQGQVLRVPRYYNLENLQQAPIFYDTYINSQGQPVQFARYYNYENSARQQNETRTQPEDVNNSNQNNSNQSNNQNNSNQNNTQESTESIEPAEPVEVVGSEELDEFTNPSGVSNNSYFDWGSVLRRVSRRF